MARWTVRFDRSVGRFAYRIHRHLYQLTGGWWASTAAWGPCCCSPRPGGGPVRSAPPRCSICQRARTSWWWRPTVAGPNRRPGSSTSRCSRRPPSRWAAAAWPPVPACCPLTSTPSSGTAWWRPTAAGRVPAPHGPAAQDGAARAARLSSRALLEHQPVAVGVVDCGEAAPRADSMPVVATPCPSRSAATASMSSTRSTRPFKEPAGMVSNQFTRVSEVGEPAALPGPSACAHSDARRRAARSRAPRCKSPSSGLGRSPAPTPPRSLDSHPSPSQRRCRSSPAELLAQCGTSGARVRIEYSSGSDGIPAGSVDTAPSGLLSRKGQRRCEISSNSWRNSMRRPVPARALSTSPRPCGHS